MQYKFLLLFIFHFFLLATVPTDGLQVHLNLTNWWNKMDMCASMANARMINTCDNYSNNNFNFNRWLCRTEACVTFNFRTLCLLANDTDCELNILMFRWSVLCQRVCASVYWHETMLYDFDSVFFWIFQYLCRLFCSVNLQTSRTWAISIYPFNRYLGCASWHFKYLSIELISSIFVCSTCGTNGFVRSLDNKYRNWRIFLNDFIEEDES